MKAIRTKFHGPTNSRGSRIVAEDGDGNKTWIHYPHELKNIEKHRKAMYKLCVKMGWDMPRYYGWFKNDCYWVWDVIKGEK